MTRIVVLTICILFTVGCIPTLMFAADTDPCVAIDTVNWQASDVDFLHSIDEAPFYSDEEWQRHISYPIEAVQRGIEGRVVVAVRVNTDGRADSVVVIASAHPLLVDAVVTATRAMSYTPGFRNSNPISSWTQVSVSFELTHYLSEGFVPPWYDAITVGLGYGSVLERPSQAVPYYAPGYITLDAAFHQERPFRGGAITEFRSNGLTASYSPAGSSLLTEIPIALGFLGAGYMNASGYAYRINESTRLSLQLARSPILFTDVTYAGPYVPETLVEVEQRSYGRWMRPGIGAQFGPHASFNVSYERMLISADYDISVWLAIGAGEMALDYAARYLFQKLMFIPSFILPVLDFSARSFFAWYVNDSILRTREEYGGSQLVERLRKGLDYEALRIGFSYVF